VNTGAATLPSGVSVTPTPVEVLPVTNFGDAGVLDDVRCSSPLVSPRSRGSC
jgi:hypothetical protein